MFIYALQHAHIARSGSPVHTDVHEYSARRFSSADTARGEAEEPSTKDCDNERADLGLAQLNLVLFCAVFENGANYRIRLNL